MARPISFHMHVFPLFLCMCMCVTSCTAWYGSSWHPCPATTALAFDETHLLMDKYYNWTTGRLNGGSVWTDANAFETVHMLMLQNGRTDWAGVADNSYIGRNAMNATVDWQTFTGGYIDDAGWVILDMWVKADYKTKHGEPHVEDFLRSAGELYDKMAENWDDTCGGGVWWTTEHTYKNAVTNQLFLTVSAQGYLRTGNETYLENAKKTWAWLESSGMRNEQGLYNDGLDDNCVNNGETTWTYNQAVLASGLGALFVATGNKTLLTEAEITLDAAIEYKTIRGILAESCDSAVFTETPCDIDQQTFKGIWMKHLAYYLMFADSKRIAAKYQAFISAQSAAVIKYATNSTGDISNLWYAQDQGGAIFNVKSFPSGIMAHVAAAQYGGCDDQV